MTPRGDATCPAAGTPCLKVADDFLIEIARVNAREESRLPLPCRRCGERNRIALGGTDRCYSCTTGHLAERDHPRASGSGPVRITFESNAHRIANESERIWREIQDEGLCLPCRSGFPMRLGIVLSRLEVDQ